MVDTVTMDANMTLTHHNRSDAVLLRSGYDLPLYGLEDGSFTTLHVTAVTCLGVTLTCAVITLVLSFAVQHHTGFFSTWTKADRFAVYMAISYGLFSSCHFADHLQIFITKDHIRNESLCVFYAFMILATITAQVLLVNVIAINTFSMMYCNYNLDFGERDWKLLLYMSVVSLGLATIPVAFGQFGPTGAYCGFDGVTGHTFYLVFIAVPSIAILVINVTLYLLTWLKIYHQVAQIRKSVGSMSAAMRAEHKAVKTMAMFVLAYILQWWALAVSAIWSQVEKTEPQFVVQLVVFFSNIGGLFNLIVFIIIHRNRDNTSTLHH